MQGLSLISLWHSGYKLQGICICLDTFSDDTSLKSCLLHQCQTSALLFHVILFQRQGFYYLSLNQLASFIPVCCSAADIFLFSPCTGNLGKQQVNEFWKTPSWQVTSYSRKIFITIISIIKYYTANAIQKSCLLGAWFEVPFPGGTFPRSCLGLWSDPSSTLLAEKKWTRFTENCSHTSLKNYS